MGKGKGQEQSKTPSEEDLQNGASGGPSNDKTKQNQTAGKPAPGKAKDIAMPVIPHKDLFQRINYSYQAAIFLQSLGSASVTSTSAGALSSLSSTSSKSVKRHDVGLKIDRKGKRKATEYEHDQIHDLEERMVNGSGRERKSERGSEEDRNMKRKLRQLARVHWLALTPSIPSLIRPISMLTTGFGNKRSIVEADTMQNMRNNLDPRPHLSYPEQAHNHLSFSDTNDLLNNNDKLDGPVRYRRRLRAARKGKRVFHEIEHSQSHPEQGGHVLWKGDEKMESWGLNSTTGAV
uniref:Uncharacterized protein n=1 Tax=Kwoniella dejecticola CBS 10117 TaxID=1296121 RepID=A0A1A6AAB2_9TREE|nr:uncharacterized protein I303_03017 [Kwoniella dejecticola CBS 10117]OBR86995.1 hypothetical protein I303_03017 [Kwoniella dejecticola CBS 10117]